MFEVFESESSISKKDYKDRLPALRAELLQTQFALQKAGIPVLIIVAGAEGAGKGEVVNRLNSWMDTRFIETSVFTKESDEEASRPFFWRFWRKLPRGGQVGVFFGSWYTRPITRHVFDEMTADRFNAKMNRIRTLEQMLVDGGMVIVKCWLHVSEKEQRRRFKALEEDERTRWRVSDTDWRYHDHYDTFLKVSSNAIRHTDTASSRWHIIDASQDRYRDIAFMETLLHQLKTALQRNGSQQSMPVPTPIELPEIARPNNILDRVELSPVVPPKEYKKTYKDLILEIEYLAWQCHQRQISSVFVFEGWDAAGKGGVIRRLIPALDAKIYRVIQISAPTSIEKANHYLWRFWLDIPRDGRVTIYDRSWYGRVLVERVEGFATREEWSRSYHEINEFEQQLIDHGTIVNKFWLHISDKEQLSRFESRQKIEYKKHKITDEDWRNREKREAYKVAVHDMVARTSTEYAPWHIVSAENKNHARIRVLSIIRDAMKTAMEQSDK
jgi:AMP-polyphosphate phosphotransferase